MYGLNYDFCLTCLSVSECDGLIDGWSYIRKFTVSVFSFFKQK